MRLYRNDDMTAVQQWAGTQEEANKAFGRGQWSLVDVPTDKPTLLAWLNGDAFDRRAIVAPIGVAPIAPAGPSFADRTIALDDAWDALPLARKLHFAELALGEARTAIKQV